MGDLQGVEGVPDLEAINNLKRLVHSLMEQEEVRWKQRAKVEWLQNGDRNMKFFHTCANQRRKSNYIRMISDARGNLCEDPDDIGNTLWIISHLCSLRSSRIKWRLVWSM